MTIVSKTIDVHDDMRVPLRDGISLSARVWMPKAAMAQPMPAILEILPYRKRDGTAARDATTHAEFCQHGYVCLRVDLRGCGESEGLFDDEYSEQELSDIEDTLGWIAKQPWCSGAIGMMGISWGGFNGLQVAARRPAALKAVISMCTSVDRFADDIHYKGGCHLTENVGWAATAMSWFSMPPDPALAGQNWRDIWLERLEHIPFLLSDWTRHSSRDDYWKHGSVCEDFSQIEAPVLCLGGWHDGYRNTPIKLLQGATSGPVKAIVGPWNHKYPHIAAPEPRIDFISECLRWWDKWLKDIPNGADTDPDYRVYVMDGVAPKTSYETRPGQWLAFSNWPAPQITQTAYAFGAGTLDTLATTELTEPVTVQTNPTCGRGTGEYFPFGFGPGELPGDQQRDDALSACFDTAPLSEPTTVLGAATVQMSLASDTSFGQIAVRLCDVAPDGSSTLISFGLLNLKFRDGFDVAQPLTPGQNYPITLDLDQAAYVIPAGHRMRIAVSPSYWPFMWPERGDVTLSIASGQLQLPALQDDTGLQWSMPAAKPGKAPPLKVTRPGTEQKQLTHDNGRDRLVIHGDDGEVENLEHGLRTSSTMTEVWSIDHDDVTSASAQIDWEHALIRDEISVSTSLETRMHCDKDAFYLSMRLRAHEGEHCVFERDFFDTVPRDVDINE